MRLGDLAPRGDFSIPFQDGSLFVVEGVGAIQRSRREERRTIDWPFWHSWMPCRLKGRSNCLRHSKLAEESAFRWIWCLPFPF
jgi:hypothetical protein